SCVIILTRQHKHDIFEYHAYNSNLREGCIPVQGKNGQIRPSTTVRAARGAGSRPHLASALQERRKSANIHASSGGIRRIPAQTASCPPVALLWPLDCRSRYERGA